MLHVDSTRPRRTVSLDVTFLDPLIALGLGLLVGLQKERAAAPIAGLKTFGLVSLLGAVSALLAASFGAWVILTGLLTVLGIVAIGNGIQVSQGNANPGQTTEVALLVMFLIGALTVVGPREVAVALGGAVAMLLNLRDELKGWVTRMTDRDVRAVMQFVVVWLVVLPILPNRTFGPFDVVNPHNVWLMVVLIVALNLAGYAAFRWMDGRRGTAMAGLLGGIVSSTATTVAYARNAASEDLPTRSAALVIWLASSVVFVRILIEIGAVAPSFLLSAAGPMVAMLVLFAGTSLVLLRHAPAGERQSLEPKNPTQLRTAVAFGLLYAGILLAVAAAERYLGSAGLYATAILSGLTDIDAITLSTSRLVASDRVDADLGWRLILTASLSNLLFKLGIARALGGRDLGRRLGRLGALAVAVGVSLILLWP